MCLLGIWFVIQKINHTTDLKLSLDKADCPVLHISKYRKELEISDNELSTQKYDSDVRYDNTDFEEKQRNLGQERRFPNEDSNRYYGDKDRFNYDKSRIPYRISHLYETKYLRMYWDDGIQSTEYILRYSMFQPGFWIIDKADEEDYIAMQTLHETSSSLRFLKGIQVIKAVGDHMVLTFCDPISKVKKKLFTIILSRDYGLEKRVIHNINKQLQGQGLLVKSTENSCNSSSKNAIEVLLLIGNLFAGVFGSYKFVCR